MTSMTCPSSSGVQDPNELNVDRISSLPGDVMNIIYGKLPIVDVVRTSILARDWRYKWLSMSDFSLDSEAITLMLDHEDRRWDVVSSVVYRYLRNHTSHIKVFSLKADCGEHYPDVYRWINYLSRQDVKELLIEDFGDSHFRMPMYLFDFEKLESLTLINCSLRIPASFGEFKFLDRLVLEDVSIGDACLDRLILSCPLLDYLSLTNISGLNHLRIEASRLTWLLIDTGFEDIVIRAAPLLSIVIILASSRKPEDRPVLDWRSVTHCLSNLESLQNLAFSGQFMKIMAADFGTSSFMLRNHSVTSLYLHELRFDNTEVFTTCLDLLSSCRSIKSLRLTIEAAKGSKFAAKYFNQVGRHFLFPCLREISVTCPSNVGMGCAVNFIDFITRYSPGLRELTIQSEGGRWMNISRIRKMMSRFRLSRPGASIFYEEDGRLTNL